MIPAIPLAVFVKFQNFSCNFTASLPQKINLFAVQHIGDHYEAVTIKQFNGFCNIFYIKNVETIDAVVCL